MTSEKPQGRSAFFYGTLMAPQVLHRVCHGSMAADNPIYTTSSLTTRPAILHNFRRHRVKYADYPAILPTSGSGESSVRGTYVTGLTDNDIWRLDIFEGDEYERRVVKVRVLKAEGDEVTGEGNVEGEEMEAETYVWISGAERLEESEWDFQHFKNDKMRFWIGADAGEEEREDIVEVDNAVAAKERAERQDGTGGRGLNGHISSALAEEHRKDSGR